MAVYHSLGALFETKQEAIAFETFFKKQKLLLGPGQEIPLTFESSTRDDGKTLLGIYPKGVSISSPEGDSRRELVYGDEYNEIVTWFYEQLEDAPDFIYAAFGGEQHEEMLTDLDFDADILEGHKHAGLVVNDLLLEKIAKKNQYSLFKEGYHWIPKETIDLD